LYWQWQCSEAGKVTAGPAEINGSLQLGLWLISITDCLSRSPGISTSFYGP